MMIGGGEQVELVSAPELADVRRRIFDRPLYLSDRPIAVEPELWHRARAQLRDCMERRGFPVLSSSDCKLTNFLLCGVPVVMTDG